MTIDRGRSNLLGWSCLGDAAIALALAGALAMPLHVNAARGEESPKVGAQEGATPPTRQTIGEENLSGEGELDVEAQRGETAPTDAETDAETAPTDEETDAETGTETDEETGEEAGTETDEETGEEIGEESSELGVRQDTSRAAMPEGPVAPEEAGLEGVDGPGERIDVPSAEVPITRKWYFWVTLAAIVAAAATVGGLAIRAERDKQREEDALRLAPFIGGGLGGSGGADGRILLRF